MGVYLWHFEPKSSSSAGNNSTRFSSLNAGLISRFVLNCAWKLRGEIQTIVNNCFEMHACYACIFQQNNERRLILAEFVIRDSGVWNVFLDSQTLVEFSLRKTKCVPNFLQFLCEPFRPPTRVLPHHLPPCEKEAENVARLSVVADSERLLLNLAVSMSFSYSTATVMQLQ